MIAAAVNNRMGWVRGTSTYADLVFVLVFPVFMLDIPSYLYNVFGFYEPKYAIGAAFALLVPVILTRGHWSKRDWIDPFLVWAVAFAALNGMHYIDALFMGDLQRAALILTLFQYAVFAALLSGLMAVHDLKFRDWTIIALALIVPLSVLVDFLAPGLIYPVDFAGTVRGRAAGTFLNPNRAGEAILLLLLLGICVAPTWLRPVMLAVAGCGVLLTFSRGAMVCYMVISLFFMLTRRLPAYTYAASIAGVLLLPLLQAVFYSYLDGVDDESGALSNVLDRLAFFNGYQANDYSANERTNLLSDGLELFYSNPFFGAGAGYTSVWTNLEGVHNQLVSLAAEYGLLGVGMWLWLIVLVGRGHHFPDRLFQYFAASVVAFLCMFSHNVLESGYWLLALPMMARQVSRHVSLHK